MTFLVSYGYMGMLIAAFLAASIQPFSSEAVMVGLQAAGLDPVALIAYGTIGNVLGSMFNYTIGRLGKMEWIEKYLHVKKEDLDKAHKFMDGTALGNSCHRRCHHSCSRTHESQCGDSGDKRHHQQTRQIHATCLRGKLDIVKGVK